VAEQPGETSLVPETLAATAKSSCEMLEAGRTATQVHSKVRGKVSNADAAAWGKIPAAAKTVSPISRLLHATNTMNASKDG